MVLLIGLIVLISVLVLKARKSNLVDNASNDLNDRGGIRNRSDDSNELSVNDSRVGGIQWAAGGLIEGRGDWGILRDPDEPVKGGIVEIFEDEEVTLPQVDGLFKEIMHLKTIPEFEHVVGQEVLDVQHIVLDIQGDEPVEEVILPQVDGEFEEVVLHQIKGEIENVIEKHQAEPDMEQGEPVKEETDPKRSCSKSKKCVAIVLLLTVLVLFGVPVGVFTSSSFIGSSTSNTTVSNTTVSNTTVLSETKIEGKYYGLHQWICGDTI